MSIAFKPGVNPQNVHPAVWVAVGIAYALYPNTDAMDITSMNDGEHHPNSLHYPKNGVDALCCAVDLRTTRDMQPAAIDLWYHRVHDALDRLGYDVVLEADHMHIEYQSKHGDQDLFATVAI